MIDKTIVISCAGQGTRLGLELPKCLVEINGKTLLEIALEELKDCKDVRVVVGYKKELIIDKLKELNYKNVTVYENENYLNTGTAGSFSCAIDETVCDNVIALDGDLIVNPVDMAKLLNDDEEFICGEEKNTEDPVLVTLEDGNVTEFSRDYGSYEWAGLAQIKKDRIIKGNKHIYQILEPLLPLKFKLIRAKEIDTPSDLESAREWMDNNFFEKKNIVDNWFKSRFNIEDNYIVSRYNTNNRDEYDFNLLKNYINTDSKVLDLGCGTGILEKRLEPHVAYIKAIDKFQEFIERAMKSSKIEYVKHDIATFNDKNIYDLIIMFGVSMYLMDDELNSMLENCYNMMNDNSHLIIKNQWSLTEDDLVIKKQYSDTNQNMFYAKYRTLKHMRDLLDFYKLSCEYVDLYPEQMNPYNNSHEYALICKRNK